MWSSYTWLFMEQPGCSSHRVYSGKCTWTRPVPTRLIDHPLYRRALISAQEVQFARSSVILGKSFYHSGLPFPCKSVGLKALRFSSGFKVSLLWKKCQPWSWQRWLGPYQQHHHQRPRWFWLGRQRWRTVSWGFPIPLTFLACSLPWAWSCPFSPQRGVIVGSSAIFFDISCWWWI